MDESRRKIFWWIAGGLLVFVVFGNQGFREMAVKLQEKRRLEKTLASLRSEHERLSRELTWLKQDPSYSEYLIRKHLGYIKKGEIEYRLLKKQKPDRKTP